MDAAYATRLLNAAKFFRSDRPAADVLPDTFDDEEHAFRALRDVMLLDAHIALQSSIEQPTPLLMNAVDLDTDEPGIVARDASEVLRGDASAVVRALADGAFGCVIHDPPARALCKEGDLDGARFYGELRRVLRPGGTLFHYVGNPESKEGGRLFGGVRERLAEAGFASIATANEAFGITAKAP